MTRISMRGLEYSGGTFFLRGHLGTCSVVLRILFLIGSPLCLAADCLDLYV